MCLIVRVVSASQRQSAHILYVVNMLAPQAKILLGPQTGHMERAA